MNSIIVWRERLGLLERVGKILLVDGKIRFSYDESYAGEAISAQLPLSPDPFSERATACFFSALTPEGNNLSGLAKAFHSEKSEFTTFLEHLNNESIGALLFTVDENEPCSSARYKEVEDNFFEEFAAKPFETAISTMGKTRLSLSGAMAKVGLYHDDASDNWFYPFNGAASTHIVKAAHGKRFPLETINEALCLGAAKRCDFPTAECKLVPTRESEPLLAVRRFDRIFADKPRVASGLPIPRRLHQEDFCQATGNTLKYEPTDGDYLGLITRTAQSACTNSFGESNLIMEYTLFDYLIGNCDNHLKNYALLYSPEWDIREIAPLYDTVSTVLYPNLYLEMGVSFGESRRIDQVTRQLMEHALEKCGFPQKIVLRNLQELADQLPQAIGDEAESLIDQGFPSAQEVAHEVLEGVKKRSGAILG